MIPYEKLREFPAKVVELERALASLITVRDLFDQSLTDACPHCGTVKSRDQMQRVMYEKAEGAIQKAQALIEFMRRKIREDKPPTIAGQVVREMRNRM
jgi:hypothetical protein